MTELEYTTVFELLTAVLLSAQAIDFGVDKARHLLQTCHMLVDLHGGQVPSTRALQAQPGEGRKTPNLVLNVAFGEPTMAVDTQFYRVTIRTGLAQGQNQQEVEQQLL